jgi:hypothetical protein
MSVTGILRNVFMLMVLLTFAMAGVCAAEERSASFLPPSVQGMIEGGQTVAPPGKAYLEQPLARSQTLMRLKGSKNFLVVEDMIPKKYEEEDRIDHVATRVSLIRPVRNKAGYVSIKKSPVIESVAFMVDRNMSWEGFGTDTAVVDNSPVLMVDDYPGGNSNMPYSIVVSLDPKHMLEVAGRAMFLDDEKKRADEFGMLVRLEWSRSDISHAEIPEAFIYCTVKNGRLAAHKKRCEENWGGEISILEEDIAGQHAKPATGNRNHNIMLDLVNIALREWLMGEGPKAWKTLRDGLTKISDKEGLVCLFGEDLSGGQPVDKLVKELQDWIEF